MAHCGFIIHSGWRTHLFTLPSTHTHVRARTHTHSHTTCIHPLHSVMPSCSWKMCTAATVCLCVCVYVCFYQWEGRWSACIQKHANSVLYDFAHTHTHLPSSQTHARVCTLTLEFASSYQYAYLCTPPIHCCQRHLLYTLTHTHTHARCQSCDQMEVVSSGAEGDMI